MNFVVNTKEPRKSEIAQKLNPDHFNISMQELEVEFRPYGKDIFNGLVDLVYGDNNGHHLIKLNVPNHNFQRSVRVENGYCLEGNVNEIFKKDCE